MLVSLSSPVVPLSLELQACMTTGSRYLHMPGRAACLQADIAAKRISS